MSQFDSQNESRDRVVNNTQQKNTQQHQEYSGEQKNKPEKNEILNMPDIER